MPNTRHMLMLIPQPGKQVVKSGNTIEITTQSKYISGNVVEQQGYLYYPNTQIIAHYAPNGDVISWRGHKEIQEFLRIWGLSLSDLDHTTNCQINKGYAEPYAQAIVVMNSVEIKKK